MIKHYNFVLDGKLIEVTAASYAEAQEKAIQIKYEIRNERNDTKEPVNS